MNKSIQRQLQMEVALSQCPWSHANTSSFVMELRKETNLIIQQDFEIKTELVTPTGLAIFKELSPLFVTRTTIN